MKILTLATILFVSQPLFADQSNDKLAQMEQLLKTQQIQIQALQNQLEHNQALFEELQKQIASNTKSSEDANNKAEILVENMEAVASTHTTKNSFGAYGELHVNLLEANDNSADKNELDLHRFVLFYGHEFNQGLRFYSELEVEHAFSGGSGPGEVEVEQAFVEYDLNRNTQLRAGVFLVPVGIINETHEPPTFYGVERNPVEKNIIPATWWEGGLAINGNFGQGMSYDFAATSGLNTTAGNAYSIRKGRQKTAEAEFNAAAYTARIRWQGIPGLELAASAQYQADVTQENDPLAGSAYLLEAHINWQYEHFSLRALYANWTLSGLGPKTLGADQQSGWYIEPSWKFNPQWGIFSRYSQWDNLAGNALDTEYSQWDFGLNFWLHPQVVFKLDYQLQSAAAGKTGYDGWNLGVGYQF